MSLRVAAVSIVLVAMLGCSSRASPALQPEIPADVPAAGVTTPPASTTAPCRDLACWQAVAATAQAAGQDDVAAATLGQAFLAAPSDATLDAWVDAWLALGAHRRAREAVDQAQTFAAANPTLAAAIATRTADLPTTVVKLPADQHHPAVDTAQRAAWAGALTAAQLQALPTTGSPVELAAVAELWTTYAATSGATPEVIKAAAQARARARVSFYEAGADLQLVATESWYTQQLLWHGEQLLMLRRVTEIADLHRQYTRLEVWPQPFTARPAWRLQFDGATEVVALTPDRQHLIRSRSNAIVINDLISGRELRRIPAQDGAKFGAIAVVGSGEAMFIAAIEGHGVGLWRGDGTLVERMTLTGTTPSITRVYTGEGTHHDNILDDVPTWPTVVALDNAAEVVAIGGSDAKIRIFDRKRKRQRVLSHAWKYVEHRHMGGNADRNTPLALHLSADARRLIAVYAHGEILEWDVQRGVVEKQHSGACNADEAAAYLQRYGEVPVRPPTAEEREQCGRAVTATISSDGLQVVTAGAFAGLRIRDLGKRASRMVFDAEPGRSRLALAESGQLAAVDLYGGVSLLQPGQRAMAHERDKQASGPIDPHLVADGRLLVFSTQPRRWYAWDVVRGEQVPVPASPEEWPLAVAPTGEVMAVEVSGGVELRPFVAGPSAVVRVEGGRRVQFTRKFALVTGDPGRMPEFVIVDLATGEQRRVTVPGPRRRATLSSDAGWVATQDHDGVLQVWRTDNGTLAHRLDAKTQDVAFAPGDAAVAWTLRNAGAKGGHVRYLALTGQNAAVQDQSLTDWPRALRFSATGSEVHVLLSDRLFRWDLARGPSQTPPDLSVAWFRDTESLAPLPLSVLRGYHRVELRADDPAWTPVARFYPLLEGGFVAVSAAGAVYGSNDAAASMVTRVSLGSETLILDGRLGWEALYQPGLVARTLAGERVEPVLPMTGATATRGKL